MVIVKEYGQWVNQAYTPDEVTNERKKQYIQLLKFVIDELKYEKCLFRSRYKNTTTDIYINRCKYILEMVEQFFNEEKFYGLHHIFIGSIYYEEFNGIPKYKNGSSNCSIYCEIDLETYDKFKPIIEEITELMKNCSILTEESTKKLNKFIELFNHDMEHLHYYSFNNYFTKRFKCKTLVPNYFINHLKEIGKEKILDKLYYCTEEEYNILSYEG